MSDILQIHPELLAFLRRCRISFARSPFYAEVWSAVVTMLWAVASWMSPKDMEQWPSMSYLLRIAGDDTWQLTGLILGIVQFVVLVCDLRWMRWGSAILACWFWSLLTLGVWASVPWAPGTVVYAVWIGVNFFSILRLLRPNG